MAIADSSHIVNIVFRMNLRQIEVFRAVMQAGSLSGGAAQLNVSTPAISRMLAHLQTRLGVTLFERRGTRLLPTAEAWVLMGEIDTAYSHIERVRSTALALRHGSGVPLRVATNLSTALELVPRALARLQTQRPGQRVSVEVAPLSRMRQGLAAGELDLAVGAFLSPELGGLESHPVGGGALMVVLPPAHPLAARASVPLQALRAVDVIGYGLGGPHGQQIEELIGPREQAPRFEVPYAYMACALVASGAGVAVVDDLTLRHFSDAGLAVRPLEPHLRYSLDVLVDPRRPRPAAAQDLIDALDWAWAQTQAVR